MATPRWILCAAGLLAAAFVLSGPVAVRPARADVAERAAYDFETDAQGFNAVAFKDGALAPDATAAVKISHEKGEFKNGAGALAYTYQVEAGTVRALFAEAKPPTTAKSLRFWIRASAPTSMILSLREDDGSEYQLPVYVPAYEWTPVTVNLDELVLGDSSSDENGKLDLLQVNGVTLLDVASMLVSMPGELAKSLGRLQGQRTLWLDDLQFSPEAAPRSAGPVQADGKSAYLVDNFDNGLVSWMPARITLTDTPFFDIFPANTTLKTLAEAAGPGMARNPLEAGGKGLRFTYKRGEKEAYALVRSLEKRDLSRADRLHLLLNLSQKSAIIIQLKERVGAEYQYTVDPDMSVGWKDLNLGLSDFSLSQNSKDENGKLDADQIKEISVLDASTFLGLPGGDVTLELDAISFQLK